MSQLLRTQFAQKARSHAAASFSSSRCQVVVCRAAAGGGSAVDATAGRRSVLLGTALAVAGAVQAMPPPAAQAYGGRKQLTAMDAGSGNKDYDALMAIVKKRKEGLPQEEASVAPKKQEPGRRTRQPKPAP